MEGPLQQGSVEVLGAMRHVASGAGMVKCGGCGVVEIGKFAGGL